MNSQSPNLTPDADTARESPGSAIPEDVVELINELITSQQQWQRRQSESEQLIAHMAEQLEHSRRSIEALSGIIDKPAGKDSPAAKDLPGRGNSPPAANGSSGNGELTWEMQKQLLLSGGTLPERAASPDPVVSAADGLIHEAESAAPNGHADEGTAAANVVSAEELAQLADAEQAAMLKRLRERLETRLRDAEVEISIERAKIHRARRELDQLRADFEQEVVRYQEEEANSRGRKKKKNCEASRWTRFLRRERS